MTTHKKLKNNPVGQIRYYWNLALFARKFEAEVNAPPEAIADLFSDIHQAEKGVFLPHSQIVDIKTVRENEAYDFDLRFKHRSSNVRYTSVKATGSIIYSQGYDATIVRGDIRLGWFYSLSVLAAVMSLIVGLMFSPELIPMFAFVVVYIAFMLWRIQRDYGMLTQLIHEKVNQAQQAQTTLTDNDDDIDLYMLEDDDLTEFISEKRF